MCGVLMGQKTSFDCGIIRLDERGKDPDWGEFKARVEFLREVRGLHVEFLRAFKEDDVWNVPFFAAHNGIAGADAPQRTIEKDTPYTVGDCRRVEPAKADAETLRVLTGLASGEVRATWLDDVVPSSRPPAPRMPEDVFSGLVGMEEQRTRLMKLARAVVRCGRGGLDSFHFVFVGNPGTGKTELASRLVSYLDLLGVTDGTHRFVKVGEADLVAKYVGHTAPKVKAVVESARGGLLFIDEFYAIAHAPHFGREAIDCLVDQLDAHRHDFVCVVAGYPDEVDETLDLNPGLRDRFGYRVEFPDYDLDELAQLFESFVRQRGFEVRCAGALRPCLTELASSHGFSNARSVRRLVDHCVCEACWNHDELVIGEKDLCAALAQCVTRAKVRRAGF